VVDQLGRRPIADPVLHPVSPRELVTDPRLLRADPDDMPEILQAPHLTASDRGVALSLHHPRRGLPAEKTPRSAPSAIIEMCESGGRSGFRPDCEPVPAERGVASIGDTRFVSSPGHEPSTGYFRAPRARRRSGPARADTARCVARCTCPSTDASRDQPEIAV